MLGSPPTMYSKTKKSSSRSRTTSFSFTMAGWLSLRRLLTSRSAMHSSQLLKRRFIFLMATCCYQPCPCMGLGPCMLEGWLDAVENQPVWSSSLKKSRRTTALVSRLTAFHTLPYVPSPSWASTLYLHGSTTRSMRTGRSEVCPVAGGAATCPPWDMRHGAGRARAVVSRTSAMVMTDTALRNGCLASQGQCC